jgi:predicted GNAT family acetyltransferase
MTDELTAPAGQGYRLSSGELSVTETIDQAITSGALMGVSVTAQLLGTDGIETTLASWSNAGLEGDDGAQSVGGRAIRSLRIAPVMLNTLPGSLWVRWTSPPSTHQIEDDWRLSLHFTDDSGPGLIWRTSADLESSGPGRLVPLADALAIDTSAAGALPAPVPSSVDVTQAVTAAGAAIPVTTVVDRPEGEYYELLVDGEQAGLLVYHVIGTHLTITHTMIERSYRGHGLSQTLLGQALDGIREKGLTVSNYCPVVGRFVESHPEYGDLLTRPRH